MHRFKAANKSVTLKPAPLNPGTVFATGGTVARRGWGRLFGPLHVGRAMPRVGLDMQETTARFVVLLPGSPPEIKAFRLVPLPLDGRRKRTLSLKPLARALSSLGANHSHITCGLGPPQCQAAILSGDDVQRPDRQALAQTLEALGLSTAPGNTLSVGYRGFTPDHQGYTLFVAAETRAAVEFAHRLKTVRADHARISSALLALQALIRNDPGVDDTQRCFVLSLGPEDALLALFENDGPLAARSIAIADSEITAAFMRPFTTDSGRVELTSRQALVLRERFDLSDTTETLLPTGHRVDTARLVALVRPTLERLAVEIAKFARHNAPAGSRRHTGTPLFITGEGAELRGLDAFLEHELHMDVRLLNPLAGVAIGLQGKDAVRIGARRHRLALAIGYALDPCLSIDLTPRGLRFHRALSLARWGARLAVAAAITMMSLHTIEAHNRVPRLRSELRDLQGITASLTPIAARVAERDRWRALLTGLDDRARVTASQRGYPLAAMHRILSDLPPQVHADQIRLTHDRQALLSITGHLMAGDAGELRAARHAILDTVDAGAGDLAGVSATFQETEVIGDLLRVAFELCCAGIPTGGETP